MRMCNLIWVISLKPTPLLSAMILSVKTIPRKLFSPVLPSRVVFLSSQVTVVSMVYLCYLVRENLKEWCKYYHTTLVNAACVIKPRCACTARVTVLGLCVSVCLSTAILTLQATRRPILMIPTASELREPEQ